MGILETAYFIGCGTIFVICFCMFITIMAIPTALLLLIRGEFIESFSTLYAYFFWFPHYAAEWANKYLHIPYWVMRILYFLLCFPVTVVSNTFRYSNTVFYVLSRICWYVLFLSVFLLKRSNLIKPSDPQESPPAASHAPQSSSPERPTVDYTRLVSHIPQNFGRDALQLSTLLARRYGMTLDEFLKDEEESLLSSRQKWAVNLRLPLPGSLSTPQKIFIYRAAESGRSIKDEIELARDTISDFRNDYPSEPPMYRNFKRVEYPTDSSNTSEEVLYRLDLDSLPPHFEDDVYHLTDQIAKFDEMGFDEYLQYKKTMLLSNRYRWAIPLQLPLPADFPEYEKVFIYQCAAFGHDVEEEMNSILTMIENNEDVLL